MRESAGHLRPATRGDSATRLRAAALRVQGDSVGAAGTCRLRISWTMDKRDEHVSPDGLLRLFALRNAGDITIGFDGFGWHTHGDVLAGGYTLAGRDGLAPEEATRIFVADVMENRAVIALLRVAGSIRDVWVTDDVAKELKYQQEGEQLTFRFWDGTAVSPS